MDPRVTTPPSALEQQFTLSMRIYDAIARVYPSVPHETASTQNETPVLDTERSLHDRLLRIYAVLQEADAAPTTQTVATAEALLAEVK
jgi:hypothetical protein